MNETSHESTKSRSGWLGRGLVLGGLAIIAGTLFLLFRDQLSLGAIAERERALRDFRDANPVLVYLLAFALYVGVTGMSLPGASALTLAYGWYFGFWPALVLVSFASTIGATTAFLLSRYLFRETFRSRFGARLRAFEENLEREGAFYLFTLRLVPVVPFFVINAAMGLTPLSAGTFYGVSQLGMLPGTAVYVYAGSTIPGLAQLADPNQLRPDEVVDWPGLVRMLDAASRDEGPATARRLWELLPEDSRTAVERATGVDGVDVEARTAIVDGLNELLRRPDLALDEPWNEIEYVDEPTENDPDTAARSDLTAVNRRLLVAVFPEVIGPPKPIIGWNLIGAFVLLGLFPLAVRRGVRWFRGARVPDATESDEAEPTEPAESG